MRTSDLPPIVQAAQRQTMVSAALAYAALGLSIIPLDGKRPTLKTWTEYQQRAASQELIRVWSSTGLLKNIGIVCGKVSGGLVVLDFDGAAGYPAFAATFPALAETYTVASGGGVGKHVYFYTENLPPCVKAMGTPIGNLELCGEGRQMVAPPSIHPNTGQPYRVERATDILRVPDLVDLAAWIESFKPRLPIREWQPPTRANFPIADAPLNGRVIDLIARTLAGQGFKEHGDWLCGSCIHPERHKNGDRNPSFGFNRQTGYGHCYVCGTMLAKEVCEILNIDPDRVGGLVERSQPTIHTQLTVKRKPSPEKLKDPPPSVPTDYKLPDWLQQYMDWSGTTGNQTPMIFHQAAGLWLLATAVGRRLYGEAPWGVKIYPNLYLMLVAGTTFYRKSTAYKLAEGVARAAIPHMLMPTPGSPERFQEALAGRLPSNFDKLGQEQRERLTKAQPFAAQRGLLKDEVSGLFGAINKRDYMVGMKDLLMELYDCPDYFDKDTQTGLNIVENAALSILGVTTPASLSCAVSMGDWDNGLLIRFALLTPEPNYAERPAAKVYRGVPQPLVDDLRTLHERLPAPQTSEMGLGAPGALRLNVQCWEQCQHYGDWLRRKCDPGQDTELDDRLKGVYGRMHVQAFKLASLFAGLDWLKTSDEVPTVTVDHWYAAQALAEGWRESAHRLLEQLDRSGDAVQEKRQQDRLLNAIRQGGAEGMALRDLYRNLNFSAKQARQLAQDLVKAGLIEERRMDRAEWFIAVEHVNESA
jgi:predicted transcriptional regulator